MKNHLLKVHLVLIFTLVLILAPLVPTTLAHGIIGFDADPLLPSTVPAGENILVNFSYTVFHSHGSSSLPWQDPWVIRLDSPGGPILASGFSLHPARGETLTHRVSVTITIPDGTPCGEHSLYIGVSDDPVSTTRQWQYKTFTIHEIKIDKTPPRINTQINSTYPVWDTVCIIFSASDEQSGLAALYASIDSNPTASQTKIEAHILTPESHTFMVKASDQAGNTSEKTLTFTIETTIDDLIVLTQKLAHRDNMGSGLLGSLEAKLNAARKVRDRSPSVDENHPLNSFVREIRAQSGKQISEATASILIKEAEYLILKK